MANYWKSTAFVIHVASWASYLTGQIGFSMARLKFGVRWWCGIFPKYWVLVPCITISVDVMVELIGSIMYIDVSMQLFLFSTRCLQWMDILI